MKIGLKTNENKRKITESGFTIIELLVVVGLIGILSAIAIPTYLAYSRNAKVTDAINTVRADLELAKVAAVKYRAMVAVLYTAQGYTIFVDNGAGGGASGDWVRSGSEIRIADRDLPPGVVIDLGTTTLAGGRVRFNTMGLPDIFGAEIIGVSGPGRQEQISINRVGRVRIL